MQLDGTAPTSRGAASANVADSTAATGSQTASFAGAEHSGVSQAGLGHDSPGTPAAGQSDGSPVAAATGAEQTLPVPGDGLATSRPPEVDERRAEDERRTYARVVLQKLEQTAKAPADGKKAGSAKRRTRLLGAIFRLAATAPADEETAGPAPAIPSSSRDAEAQRRRRRTRRRFRCETAR